MGAPAYSALNNHSPTPGYPGRDGYADAGRYYARTRGGKQTPQASSGNTRNHGVGLLRVRSDGGCRGKQGAYLTFHSHPVGIPFHKRRVEIMKGTNPKGFTLIELLVVIAIIAILAAILF